ncbi:unnamed protein product [Dovyalis caffra]|uniref:Uncharacterized protein n=1 Tax=Dovyalis caffra TaxID=77055 RepID=A0AAV1RL87_9ROSI|nr:unnamed protein product [Dovyalis caffra]
MVLYSFLLIGSMDMDKTGIELFEGRGLKLDDGSHMLSEISKELKKNGHSLLPIDWTDAMDKTGVEIFKGRGLKLDDGSHMVTTIGEGTSIKGPHWILCDTFNGAWGFRKTDDGRILKKCTNFAIALDSASTVIHDAFDGFP